MTQNIQQYLITSQVDISKKYLPPRQVALVLGASVRGQALSAALQARMQAAVDLYKRGIVSSVLLSGDGLDTYYNETEAMRLYALKFGVGERFVVLDEKGLNTYATMVRAREVFHARSAYVITQEFHLARAVWLARHAGIDACGISAGRLKDRNYYYHMREFFARFKDYIQLALNIPP